MILSLSVVALLFSLIPAYFYFRNIGVYQTLRDAAPRPAAVSVLIPARDEAANIGPCVQAVLANPGVEFEVVVLDDHSTDGTAEVVQGLAANDPRVRLANGEQLPAGWNGKQHACWQLAAAAQNDVLLFLDADVRLEPDAVARIAAEVERGADLVSGFPRQVTGTLAEKVLIPLIHFVLLGFLSLRAMRCRPRPSLAAGCGQLFATTRAVYEQAGGHAAIRSSRHDGVKLPRQYVAQGLTIDVFDATDLASVRMYQGAAETWNGLAKNADEGVATWRLLPPVTALLLLGQVAPFALLLVSAALLSATFEQRAALALSAIAVGLTLLVRANAARRFHQSSLGAALHPIGVVLFLVIQWQALLRKLTGRQVSWKGRPAAVS